MTTIEALAGSSFWIKLLAVFGISMLPIIELKGSIPIGYTTLHLPLALTFLTAYIGSCLPVPFIIFFLKPVIAWMKGTRPLKKIAHKVELTFEKRKHNVIKYKYVYWGLFIFVAIPLPGTGVWTGSLIAAMLNLRVKTSTWVILLGNVVAGGLILIFSYFLKGLF